MLLLLPFSCGSLDHCLKKRELCKRSSKFISKVLVILHEKNNGAFSESEYNLNAGLDCILRVHVSEAGDRRVKS